ncbi:tryptophan synthase beta chain 2, chloroplastic [Tanacetum coccineum]|uniref:Tryptophan synthase beta chain 2, chloroplastic n=1 Tax=Tanacetum coccineum TaxID=301880 RepID=A0ABQ5CRN8_9ASTR
MKATKKSRMQKRDFDLEEEEHLKTFLKLVPDEEGIIDYEDHEGYGEKYTNPENFRFRYPSDYIEFTSRLTQHPVRAVHSGTATLKDATSEAIRDWKTTLEKWGRKPDVLVACVGGGFNAMGLFHEFVDDKDVRLIGVEAAGFWLDSGKHAATLTKGEVGVLHGAMSYYKMMMDR